MDSQAVSFRVDKDDFANAVGWVARSLPAKPAQPVLRGMVITASDEGLELAGFDYEVSTQVKIPAEVNEAGRIAVAGKLLADITAMLPNKPVELRVEGSNVLVTCGSARFEIPVILAVAGAYEEKIIPNQDISALYVGCFRQIDDVAPFYFLKNMMVGVLFGFAVLNQIRSH